LRALGCWSITADQEKYTMTATVVELSSVLRHHCIFKPKNMDKESGYEQHQVQSQP
jgi:hypothetical protein